MENRDRNPMLQEIQCRQQNGQTNTNSESAVNEEASCSDEFETAEVIICPDHETERLDRVCVKCKKIICVLCAAEDMSHQDHEVKFLGNKGCMKDLKEHFQDDLTTVHQKLDHFQEALDKIYQSESDTHNEFRRVEDTVVHTIREVFLRKERDFLEKLRGKQTVLMTQREVLKASVNEMTSLVSKITSGRCSLSTLYQTFSALNSLSSLASAVEIRIKDHDVSDFGQKSEQELRDTIVECQGSLQNVIFSRKRKIEVKEEDAMSPERMAAEPSKRKSMDTSSLSLTQSQENSSLKDFEKTEEAAEAELSMQFPNKDLKAADCFILVKDGDDSIMETPDPCSTQVEGCPCYSTTCAGRSEDGPRSSEISGNISNIVNLDIVDAETQSDSVEYPLMMQLMEDMTETVVTKITTASLIQQRCDQNTENSAKSKDTNSTFNSTTEPCRVFQAATPQVEPKSCTKSKRAVFLRNLVFNEDDSDVNSQAFPSDHEDNPTSSTVTMSWAGEDNTAPINRNGKKSLIRIDESSDVNSRPSPSDHDDDTSSTVTMSWAEDGDSSFKAPPLIYRNGKKSLRNVVEKGSFAENRVSSDECSCSTTTNDDSTWGTNEDQPYRDPTLQSSHTLQLNFGQFNKPEGLAVGPSSTIYVDEDSHVISRSFPRDHDDATTSSTVTTSCTDDGESTVMYPPFLGNQVAVGECSCTTTNDTSTSEDLQNDPALPPNQTDSPQPHFQEPPYVTNVIKTFGSKGKKPDQFNEPEGLAVGPNGNIFVADSLNNRIQVFNPDLEFVNSIGKIEGKTGSSLNKPFDVTVCLSNANRDVSEVNRNAVVIVVDKFNNKLQLFWEDGEFSEKFGKKGRTPQKFEGPSCVTVNSKGHLIVTDTLNHRIQVIKPNGQGGPVVFGSKGDGFGDFSAPVGVAVDGNDNIIVADYGNNRIKMLSATGETLRIFGEGELSKPSHVAVSPRGNVFVSDSGNHRIQIYDKDGKYMASFGSLGKEPGWFQQPGGIAWLTNGHLVVSDAINCRLQIFDCPY